MKLIFASILASFAFAQIVIPVPESTVAPPPPVITPPPVIDTTVIPPTPTPTPTIQPTPPVIPPPVTTTAPITQPTQSAASTVQPTVTLTSSIIKTNPPTPQSTPSNSSSAISPGTQKTLIIIGSIVGGVLFLAIVALVYRNHTKTRKAKALDVMPSFTPHPVSPGSRATKPIDDLYNSNGYASNGVDKNVNYNTKPASGGAVYTSQSSGGVYSNPANGGAVYSNPANGGAVYSNQSNVYSNNVYGGAAGVVYNQAHVVDSNGYYQDAYHQGYQYDQGYDEQYSPEVVYVDPVTGLMYSDQEFTQVVAVEEKKK